MMKDIVLCQGKRTPFGDFGKSLANTLGTDLAVHAAKATLDASRLSAEKVDHLVCGNVIPVDQRGYFFSRVIALNCVILEDSSALNISRVCGSGTQAIVSAAEQILSWHSRIALAGGYENSSRAPYAFVDSRWGMELLDTIDYVFPIRRVAMMSA